MISGEEEWEKYETKQVPNEIETIMAVANHSLEEPSISTNAIFWEKSY